jgi:hypothetical protein
MILIMCHHFGIELEGLNQALCITSLLQGLVELLGAIFFLVVIIVLLLLERGRLNLA